MAGIDIAQDLWGVRGRVDDYAICSAAFLAAQQLFGRHVHVAAPFEALAAVGGALQPSDGFDGVFLAKAWLLNPPIGRLDEALLQQISTAVSRSVDPSHAPTRLSVASEILTNLNVQLGNRATPLPALASFMIFGSAVEKGDKVACAFPQASQLALRLAASNPVRFFAGNETVAITSALLGLGTRSSLSVDVRDPLSRSAFGTRRSKDTYWSPSEVDHLFTMPPLGKRYDLGDGRGSQPAEVLQFGELGELWSKTMMTVVTDGFLHRSSGAERRIRETIIGQSTAMVVTLPTGLCGTGPAANTSLLGVRRNDPGDVDFFDGRTLDVSVRRPTPRHLLDHLAGLPVKLEESPGRHRRVAASAVKEEDYNLSVDRYLRAKPPGSERPSGRPPPMRLDIAADIIRPQAAKPVSAEFEDSFEALEVSTVDIIDGIVSRPSKLVRFSRADSDRVSRSMVQSHDIVMCIKGRVGLVGLVPKMDEDDRPWVISQSFAIVRPRDEPGSDLPVVLAAMLTAPWVMEKLQALAGGTSVQMLQMADIRAFEIPMPFGAEEREALKSIRENEILQERVSRLCQDIRRNQQKIWTTLWGTQTLEGDGSQ